MLNRKDSANLRITRRKYGNFFRRPVRRRFDSRLFPLYIYVYGRE